MRCHVQFGNLFRSLSPKRSFSSAGCSIGKQSGSDNISRGASSTAPGSLFWTGGNPFSQLLPPASQGGWHAETEDITLRSASSLVPQLPQLLAPAVALFCAWSVLQFVLGLPRQVSTRGGGQPQVLNFFIAYVRVLYLQLACQLKSGNLFFKNCKKDGS